MGNTRGEIDRVDLIVVWGNTPSGSVVPVAESLKMPTIAVSSNPDAKDKKFTVSFGFKLEAFVDELKTYFSRSKVKKLSAVSIDLGNALRATEMLKDQLLGKLSIFTVANADTDFKSLIARLKAGSFDAVLLLALPEQSLTFIRQARQMNFHPEIIGGDTFADSDFIQRSKESSSHLSFVYGAVEPTFLQALEKLYSSKSFFFESACGYSIAAISERAYGVGALFDGNFTGALKKISLTGLPTKGLLLADDSEYGLHFESQLEVYGTLNGG